MKRWIAVIIAALMVFSMACAGLSLGGRDGDTVEVTVVADDGVGDEDTEDVEDADVEDETPVEDAAPADDTSSGDEDVPEDAVPDIDADAFEQLDSYRATLTWTTENADGTTESFEMEQAATRDPAASQFLMSTADGTMEFVQIGDQMYMRFGEEWIQTSSEDAADQSGFGDFLTTGDEWVSNMEDEDYEYLGKETVDGITARGYSYAFDTGLLGMLGSETDADIDSMDTGTAEVWVADEPDLPQFVVRFQVDMTGTVDGEDASATMVMEVTEINEPFTIEVPEGAAEGGLPEGVPVYPDAFDVTTFGSMTILSTTDDMDTVNAFYTDALQSAGWTETDESFSSEEMVNSIWEKDGDRLTLTLTPGEDEGTSGTGVMISVESGE